jgi:hypothetical protein
MKRYVAVGRSHRRRRRHISSLSLAENSLALRILHIEPTVIVKWVRRSNRLEGSCRHISSLSLAENSVALPVLHIEPTVIVKCVCHSNRLEGSCMLILIDPTESKVMSTHLEGFLNADPTESKAVAES